MVLVVPDLDMDLTALGVLGALGPDKKVLMVLGVFDQGTMDLVAFVLDIVVRV